MPVNEREVKKKDMECSRRGRERSLTETVAEGKKTLRGGKQRKEAGFLRSGHPGEGRHSPGRSPPLGALLLGCRGNLALTPLSVFTERPGL